MSSKIDLVTNIFLTLIILPVATLIIQVMFLPFNKLPYIQAVEASNFSLILMGINCFLIVIGSFLTFSIQTRKVVNEEKFIIKNDSISKVRFLKSILFYSLVILVILNTLTQLLWFDSYASYGGEFGEIPQSLLIVLALAMLVVFYRLSILVAGTINLRINGITH